MTWTLHSSTSSLAVSSDIAAHLTFLGTLAEHPVEAVRQLFDPTHGIFVGRAPGRIDLMGGIADYSGSLVLQLPTQEATLASLQPLTERSLTIISISEDRPVEDSIYQVHLDEFTSNGNLVDYAQASHHFKRNPETQWAAYVAGAFIVLMREEGTAFPQGANILIRSAVPERKRVSSSAAVQVATMSAIAAAYGLSIPPRRLAILCQMVENLVVGAPCGVMDQMMAACGTANELLALLCQPAEIQEPVSIPPELAVWGIDSGIRHAVSGADYGSVRIGAFMGYRILLDLAGIAPDTVPPTLIEDSRWQGYLANVTPSEFEQAYRQHPAQTRQRR